MTKIEKELLMFVELAKKQVKFLQDNDENIVNYDDRKILAKILQEVR